MPRIDISEAQISEIAAWLHSLKVISYATAAETPINIVIGDASIGEVFFEKTCASCHSVRGDLKGLATRIPDPRVLQQTWLLPGAAGMKGTNRGSQPSTLGLHVPPMSVTVTTPDGRKVEGELRQIDDFYVGLKQSDGTLLSFTRVGDKPKVELHDPLAQHRKLLRTYTDKDIHNLTAYLVTIQ
jgi:cytochrome c553